MDVAGCNRVGIDKRNAVGVREDDVLVRRRRRVAAEHAACLHGRGEAAQEREAILAELRARPVRCLEHALVGLFVAELERNEKVIRVPVDARTSKLLQQRNAFARLRPALGDVAERDDQVGLDVLQVGQSGAEGDGVAVHVGEEGDAHTGTL